MDRKFKQWWSTIPPTSTKWTTIFYLKPLNHILPQTIEHQQLPGHTCVLHWKFRFWFGICEGWKSTRIWMYSIRKGSRKDALSIYDTPRINIYYVGRAYLVTIVRFSNDTQRDAFILFCVFNKLAFHCKIMLTKKIAQNCIHYQC